MGDLEQHALTQVLETMEGKALLLLESIERRARAFEATHARRYSDNDLAADALWAEEMAQYRALRMELHRKEARDAGLTQGVKGGCQFFIARRRRFCSNMAAVGSLDQFCTEHSGGCFDSQIASKPKCQAAAGQGGQKEEARACPGAVEARPGKPIVKRMHYMVNPFSMPRAHGPEPWNDIYGDVSKPLLLDVGCAKGRWIEHMASETSVRLELNGRTFNYCGVEIYEPLVELAIQRRQEAADPKRNLHYVHANIISSLKTLELPNLHTVCFQFCDPWLKKARRRTVTPEVARAVAEILPCGGQVYLVSDYLEIAADMRSHFLSTGAFFLSAETSCEVVPVEDAAVAAFAGRRKAREGAGGDAVAKVHVWQGMPSVVSWTAQAVGSYRAWLPVRPFYLGTERDHVCEEKWRPSYRCILIKK